MFTTRSSTHSLLRFWTGVIGVFAAVSAVPVASRVPDDLGRACGMQTNLSCALNEPWHNIAYDHAVQDGSSHDYTQVNNFAVTTVPAFLQKSTPKPWLRFLSSRPHNASDAGHIVQETAAISLSPQKSNHMHVVSPVLKRNHVTSCNLPDCVINSPQDYESFTDTKDNICTTTGFERCAEDHFASRIVPTCKSPTAHIPRGIHVLSSRGLKSRRVALHNPAFRPENNPTKGEKMFARCRTSAVDRFLRKSCDIRAHISRISVPEFSEPQRLALVEEHPIKGAPSFRALTPSGLPLRMLTSGLSFDICIEDLDCKQPRTCYYVGEDTSGGDPCRRKQPCMCIPPKLYICTSSLSCEKGEVCASGLKYNTCIAKKVVSQNPYFTEITNTATVAPATTSTDEQSSSTTASLTSISPTSTATSQLATATVPSASIRPTSTGTTAVAPTGASSSTAQSTDTVTTTAILVVSVSPTTTATALPSTASHPSVSAMLSPSASEGGDARTKSGVCVDARTLVNMRPDELVFTRHVTASVLCDVNGSCATSGHMIVFQGVSMMMKRYCLVIGCKEQALLVNSPIYKRGLKIPTNTADLYFTSFSARYETYMEEVLLSAMVRFGF